MRRLLRTAIVLCAVSAALGRAAPTGGQTVRGPHPAVARVIVNERGAISYGSGALIAADDTLGLVVTNWHVVRDAAGEITVVFPDGFRSNASVLAVDRDWDLAALAIRRPNVRPIEMAAEIPQQGDPLTIAGYGKGTFRASTGRCTQFVSPGHGLPSEMVEVDTAARQGDSGGPILNQRGQLAGVLFGSGFGRTAGSHCDRVRTFLDGTADSFRQLSSQTATMIARQTQESLPPAYRPPVDQPSQSPTQLASIGSTPPTAPNVAPASMGRLPSAASLPPQAQQAGTVEDRPHWLPSPPPEQPAPRYVATQTPLPRSQEPPIATAPVPARLASSAPAPTTTESSRDWSSSWESTYPKTPWANAPAASVASNGGPPLPIPTSPTRGDQLKTILAAVGILAILFHGLRLLGSLA